MRKFFLNKIFLLVCFITLGQTIYFDAVSQTPLHLLRKKAVAGYDTDAQAFFTALEADAAPVTLTSDQKGYVNTFVLALKTANVWTKMKAIYPVVGGTAASHKYNLKDPRDLDAAFRLVFTGGWTHASTGMAGNGTDGYANTFLVPNTSLALGSAAIGVYSRTNNSVAVVDMGAATGSTQKIQLFIRHSNNNNIYYVFGGSPDGTISNSSGALSTKLHIASRTSTTAFSVYRDGTSLASTTGATIGTLPTHSIYIGAINNVGVAGIFSARELAGAFISDGLSSTEVTDVNNAFNTFETSWGRNV